MASFFRRKKKVKEPPISNEEEPKLTDSVRNKFYKRIGEIFIEKLSNWEYLLDVGVYIKIISTDENNLIKENSMANRDTKKTLLKIQNYCVNFDLKRAQISDKKIINFNESNESEILINELLETFKIYMEQAYWLDPMYEIQKQKYERIHRVNRRNNRIMREISPSKTTIENKIETYDFPEDVFDHIFAAAQSLMTVHSYVED